MRIPLTRPQLSAEDLDVMAQAVQAGQIAQGAVTRSFEGALTKLLGAAGAVATNSGTSALVLALKALEVGPGDEVILPSYTCTALPHAVAQVGATAILADSEYDPHRMDYNLGPHHVRPLLGGRTKAVVVPHMFGVAARVDEIAALGPPVIEDVTLALGARRGTRPVGAWGALSVCSFHQSKMVACGEGGAVLANSPELAQRLRFLNGWEEEQATERFSREPPAPYTLRYNFHLSDCAAALGHSQLRRLPESIGKRRRLARQYAERLGDLPGIVIPDATDGDCVFFRFIVSLKSADVISVLEDYAASGIECGRGVFPPLHRIFGLDPARFPGAERAAATALSVPLYPALSDEDAEYVLERSHAILAGCAS